MALCKKELVSHFIWNLSKNSWFHEMMRQFICYVKELKCKIIEIIFVKIIICSENNENI